MPQAASTSVQADNLQYTLLHAGLLQVITHVAMAYLQLASSYAVPQPLPGH